mgnify:CR=1 FL=1
MKRKTLKLLLSLTLVLCVALALPGLSAGADYVNSFEAGKDIGSIQVFSSNLVIKSYEKYAGSLPAGLSLSWDDYGIYMAGTPTSAGNFSSSYNVVTENGTYSFIINISITGGTTPTATPAPGDPPHITKHPTGETVEPGGSAQFVARADDATKITWRLVSKDTTVTYTAADAPDYFPGLGVDGLGTERLTLENIPSALNEWCVEAKFENANGASYSNGARITVKAASNTNTNNNNNSSNSNNNNSTNTNTNSNTNTTTGNNDQTTGTDLSNDGLTTKTPNINLAPQSTRLKKGETCTLTVQATSPNNGELSYQWYSTNVNNRGMATPIDGATNASYTPTQTEGTMYYCVAVMNTREGITSEPVYTDLAEVSFEPEATPTPVPTATPTRTSSDNGSYNRGNSTQLIFFGIIGFLALAALVGVVVYLRIDSKRSRDE